MIVPVMAISNLVLTRQIYSEETNGAHAHYRDRVPLIVIFRISMASFQFTKDNGNVVPPLLLRTSSKFSWLITLATKRSTRLNITTNVIAKKT